MSSQVYIANEANGKNWIVVNPEIDIAENFFQGKTEEGFTIIGNYSNLKPLVLPESTPTAELEEAYQDDFFTEFEEACTADPMQTALARKDYAIESVVLQGEYHDYDAMQEITEELAREFLGVAA